MKRTAPPIAYTDYNEHFYAYFGRPLRYVHEGSIYSYPGHHLEFISYEVIRDNHGFIAGYTAESRRGLMKLKLKPVPQTERKPMRYLKC